MAYPSIDPTDIFSADRIQQIHEQRFLPARSWFNKANLRVFNTRKLQNVYKGVGGVYFVVSQQNKTDSNNVGKRYYAVCKFYLDSAMILPVGPHFMTPSMAKETALIYANKAEEYKRVWA